MSTTDRFGPLPGTAQKKIVELKGDFQNVAKAAQDNAEQATTAAKNAWGDFPTRFKRQYENAPIYPSPSRPELASYTPSRVVEPTPQDGVIERIAG